jgi:hypothetical protein
VLAFCDSVPGGLRAIEPTQLFTSGQDAAATPPGRILDAMITRRYDSARAMP